MSPPRPSRSERPIRPNRLKTRRYLGQERRSQHRRPATDDSSRCTNGQRLGRQCRPTRAETTTSPKRCRLQGCRARNPSNPSPSPRSPQQTKSESSKAAAAKTETPKAAAAPPFVDVATEFDEDRKPAIHTGGDVLIKGATILTVTRGTIAKGSILVEHGKIKAVGSGVTAPVGVKVIDATGLVAMPGIIDTHSHIAVQGGVNEGTLSVVPEVRVKDVVTGDDVAIHRAIAGGTTTARLLHGSANTIGGQHAVVKLRYGQARTRPDHQGRALRREVRPG